MKDKFNKIKDWISSIDKTKVKDWFIKFNKSQLNWIRLGVIGIWIITLININQFLNNKNSGAIPVYVEGGRIGVDSIRDIVNVNVDGVYDVVEIQGSVNVDNTVEVELYRSGVSSW